MKCEGGRVASHLGCEEWDTCKHKGAIYVGYISLSAAGTAEALGDEGWRVADHAYVCRTCLDALRDIGVDEETLWRAHP